MINHIQQYY